MLLISAALALSAQDPDLPALLGKMDEARRPVRDLRADIAYFAPVQLRTGTRDLRRWSAGTFAFRSAGDAAWALKPDRADHFVSSYLDASRGISAAVRGETYTLHVPWRLHRPADGPGRQQNYPYGAEWYRGKLDVHTPPILPMLLAHPGESPVALLFDLAPGRRLGALPSLRLAGRQVSQGRDCFVLSAGPANPDPEARKEEARRTWDSLTWMGADIWVDAKTFLIDRILVTHKLASSGPPFSWRKEYRFSRRDPAGLPTSIGILTSLDGDASKSWNARLDLTGLRVNAGEDPALALAPPPGRIPRDLFPQAPASYAADDPSGWLSVGALHMRLFQNAEAEDAFRRVIAARPKAEEGYVGLVYALAARRPAADREIVEALSLATRNGAGTDLLRWELAHRDPARALEHLAPLLKSRGEDPDVLEAMAELVARDPAEKRSFWARIVQADLGKPLRSPAWRLWLESGPTDKERAAMTKVLEEGVRKSDHLGTRLFLLDLGRKTHAAGALALLEKGPSPQDLRALDRLIEVFRAGKDADGPRRLSKVFAGRDDDDAETARLILEAEEMVATGTVERWVVFFDERISPPDRNRLDRHAQPCARFLQALKREKRLIPFLERLLKTPPNDDRRRFHEYAATSLAMDLLEGAEKDAFLLRERERKTGQGASAGELVGLAERHALDKQWKDAESKAAEALARKDASGNERARAERVRAQVHEAASEWDKAAAACARGLAEKDVYPRYDLRLFQARMLLRAKDPKGAAAACAAAFEEAALEPGESARWRHAHALVVELSRPSIDVRDRDALLEAVEGESSPGRTALKAVLLKGRDPAAAAEAFGRLLTAWPGHPVVLRERLVARARAGQLGPALDDRAALVPIVRVHFRDLRCCRLETLDEADTELARACGRVKDVAAARRFVEALASEPLTSSSFLLLGAVLALTADEAFIEKIHAALIEAPGDEWRTFHARYPAAFAWHALGKTAKAVALYKEAAAGKEGWSPSYVQVAQSWIAQWEKEAGR